MPYRSSRQKRFMEMCKNNPGDANKACPPKKVLNEFHQAEYPTETTTARHAQKKRGGVKYM
jgi:hypothetical protein